MNTRYRLVHRGIRGGMYYCFDKVTGKRASINTTNEDAARQIIEAKNQAVRQPAINLQIAQAYLQHGDPVMAKRTWQDVMDAMAPLKTGPTQRRWIAAMRDKPFDLIPPNTNNSSLGGDGYALITNYAGTTGNPVAATARITGALADGTAFDQTVPVSKNGYVPIYANLYSGKGLLMGWINLNLTNTTGVSLTWIHPACAAGLYLEGFTNNLFTNEILLSPWTDPPANIIGLLTNLSMLDTINDTNVLSSFPVTISSSGEIGPKPLSGSISLKTGLLKVTIGKSASTVTGYGVVLLNTTNGGGYFLTKTNAQAIQLEP